jgi:hypothetical protein
MKYYTYAHFTADTKELYYIGKGKGNRAFSSLNRNRWWQHKVNKHGGFVVEILAEWPTEKEALEHEKFLIDCLEDTGHCLTNIQKSLGKETEGRKLSLETRKRMSVATLKRWESLSEDQKEKRSTFFSKLLKGKNKTEQHKAALSKARTGIQVPSTWKQIHCITTNVIYPSLTEAALDTGCDPSHIVKCCKGKLKQTKKKEFAYVSS